MDSESTIIDLFPDPCGRYYEWIQSVRQFAASLLIIRYTLGMLHTVCSDEEWNSYSVNRQVDGETGEITFKARPTIPPEPLALLASAGGGTVKNFQIATELRENYLLANDKIRRSILASLGADIRKAIGNPTVGGAITLSITEILQFVQTNFGTRTNAACDAICKAMQELIADDEVATFLAFSTRFTELVMRLETARQPLSHRAQVMQFKDVTYHHGHIAKGWDLYIEQNPMMDTWKLADLIARIKLHLANVDRGAQRYAAATTAMFTQSQLDKAVQDAVTKALAKTNPGQAKTKHYCYFHGYKNHPGNACTVMLADPSTYTTDKLQAKNPRRVPGGHP